MLCFQIFFLRKQNRISQAQLAKVLNISPSTLGMYEQGRREPSIDILVSMASYFRVSLDYLITGSDFPPSEHKKNEGFQCNTCFGKECNK